MQALQCDAGIFVLPPEIVHDIMQRICAMMMGDAGGDSNIDIQSVRQSCTVLNAAACRVLADRRLKTAVLRVPAGFPSPGMLDGFPRSARCAWLRLAVAGGTSDLSAVVAAHVACPASAAKLRQVDVIEVVVGSPRGDNSGICWTLEATAAAAALPALNAMLFRVVGCPTRALKFDLLPMQLVHLQIACHCFGDPCELVRLVNLRTIHISAVVYPRGIAALGSMPGLRDVLLQSRNAHVWSTLSSGWVGTPKCVVAGMDGNLCGVGIGLSRRAISMKAFVGTGALHLCGATIASIDVPGLFGPLTQLTLEDCHVHVDVLADLPAHDVLRFSIRGTLEVIFPLNVSMSTVRRARARLEASDVASIDVTMPAGMTWLEAELAAWPDYELLG